MFCWKSSLVQIPDSSFTLQEELRRRSTGQLIYFAGTALSQRHRTARLIRGNKSVAETPDSSSISREMLLQRYRTAYLFRWEALPQRHWTAHFLREPVPRGNSFVAEAPDSSLISREHLFSLQEQLCRRGTGQIIFYGNSSVVEALDSSFFAGTSASREQLCCRGTG